MPRARKLPQPAVIARQYGEVSRTMPSIASSCVWAPGEFRKSMNSSEIVLRPRNEMALMT